MNEDIEEYWNAYYREYGENFRHILEFDHLYALEEQYASAGWEPEEIERSLKSVILMAADEAAAEFKETHDYEDAMEMEEYQ